MKRRLNTERSDNRGWEKVPAQTNRWKKEPPGSVVQHHGVPRGAGDAVVVLEQAQVPPPAGDVSKELLRWERVSGMIVSTETTHVGQSQAEEDF